MILRPFLTLSFEENRRYNEKKTTIYDKHMWQILKLLEQYNSQVCKKTEVVLSENNAATDGSLQIWRDPRCDVLREPQGELQHLGHTLPPAEQGDCAARDSSPRPQQEGQSPATGTGPPGVPRHGDVFHCGERSFPETSLRISGKEDFPDNLQSHS